VKFYRGSAAGARAYVEAGRSRADEYYLGEGEGLAARYAATAQGRVERVDVLDGAGYEAWVAGFDPTTGVARGRLRDDPNALRFCEVVINGPKSWSLAAELHPQVAAAYDAAQAKAAEQVVGWFGAHASTRVGPRGGQVATAVERIEACAVVHRTSRCGDPHRHVHLQINARVLAEGKWRGIDSVAVRESIAAAQGIGHAAIACDPGFRTALAAHGYTLDPGSGEVRELAPYVAGFSRRHVQIAGQAAGYEAEWRAANPGQEPGRGLRAGWDTRAWAEDRPDKPTVEAGVVLQERWRADLAAAGYRAPERRVGLAVTPVGGIDRDAAAGQVLARVGARRSGFNPADLRGEVEQLLARRNVVAEPGVRAEVAEDITARAAASAVPLLDRVVPEHVRAWTTREALVVETELAGRFAARAVTDTGRDASGAVVEAAAAAVGVGLDAGQAEVVAALAGEHALVVVTGAAGAGKTTTLTAARAAVEAGGRQLVVVTPTLKAARVAAAETGAAAGSAAWLAHQHGWRWDTDGAWTRLAVGETDPATGKTWDGPGEAARLRAGDLLVVDEAGMLDQDTARALLSVADEHAARVALVGDVHQLPAVGRGGVLALAERWTEREVTLDVVHRFTARTEIEPGVWADVPDRDYAQLSLTMRQGAAGDPGAVFDALAGRGQVQVHRDAEALREHLARQAAEAVLAGHPAAVCAATNEAVRELNTAIRDRLVAAGHVDDQAVALTAAGQRIGAGDTVVTRANDRDLDVANRDTWTVTAVHPDGALTVTPTDPRHSTVADQGRERLLPVDYVTRDVELGYAATVHGVQGQTAHSGHLVLDEHTSAAAAYVGMTRGRQANTVHLLADDQAQARARWVDTAGRGRADLGPEAARRAAELAAARYPGLSPTLAQEMRLGEVQERLGQLWTAQDKAQAQAAQLEQRLAQATAAEARRQAAEVTLAPLREMARTAAAAAEAAKAAADAAQARLDEHAAALREQIRTNWDRDRAQAHEAAQRIIEGPGRFGRITGGRTEVEQAREWLGDWAEKWGPVVPSLSPDTAFNHANPYPSADHWIGPVIDRYAKATATVQLPEHVATIAAAHHATDAARTAEAAYQDARQQQWTRHGGWTSDAARLPELTQALTSTLGRVQAITTGIERLAADPAVRSQPEPGDWLEATRQGWEGDRTHARAAAAVAEIARRREAERDHYYDYDHTHHRERDHGIDLGY
jgi:hypothetical protein